MTQFQLKCVIPERIAVIRTGVRKAVLPSMYCCSLYFIVHFKFPTFSTKGSSLVTIQWITKKSSVKNRVRLKTCEKLIEKKNSTIIKTQKLRKKNGTVVELAENFLACVIKKGGKKRRQSAAAQLIVLHHIEPIQAVFLACAVWHK